MITMQEKQKDEAVMRMQQMELREDIWLKFADDGVVTLCENGQCHPISKELEDDIRRFEQEHEATVFLAVRMSTTLGVLDALLFVGKYEEEWELEREDLEDGYAMTYTINHDYPDCSEMGSISFRVTDDGVIVREG